VRTLGQCPIEEGRHANSVSSFQGSQETWSPVSMKSERLGTYQDALHAPQPR